MNVNPIRSFPTNATGEAYAERLRASLADKAAQRVAAKTDADGDNDGSTRANEKA